ncbi:conserved hypothetical protein [Leptospira interrogans serovar Manilae]|uniref:Uncharacterized protein n=1 Tax=Leptospira interrogans serovar Manilae TaxID=214675 RepID=A0AAQ1NY42_LEPIR|nr:conserved hypothetical protein [Leptospira interrogans serovar Manilae]
MWELPQVEILQSNSENVGTTTNQDFYSLTPKMWELPQIKILQSNFKFVGTTTSRDFTV